MPLDKKTKNDLLARLNVGIMTLEEEFCTVLGVMVNIETEDSGTAGITYEWMHGNTNKSGFEQVNVKWPI